MINRNAGIWVGLVAGAWLAVACSGSDEEAASDTGTLDTSDASGDGGEDTTGDGAGDVGSDLGDPSDPGDPCDAEAHRPIVFVHGFLSAGDNWGVQAQRFTSNGYCLASLYAFDWNTLNEDGDHEGDLLAFVEAVLAETGADQVDMVGHSMGGNLAYDYLADPERAALVAHYGHVASFFHEGPAGPEEAPVPTLNVWSPADTVIDDKGDIEGAENLELADMDHVWVATSTETFAALFAFFNDGEEPTTTDVLPGNRIVLSGKVLTLGENQPDEGATVEVWPVDPDTAERLQEDAAGTFVVAADGSWGPFQAEPDTYYELRVQGPDEDDRPVHYYREPFQRANPFVYMRVFPPPASIPGFILGEITFGDDHAVFVTFFSQRALTGGRDTFSVDGMELATEEIASPAETTLAIFFYDGDEDGESSYEVTEEFASLPFPFLQGIDTFIDASTPAPIEVVYNGRTIHARNWPSGTEGVTIIVLE